MHGATKHGLKRATKFCLPALLLVSILIHEQFQVSATLPTYLKVSPSRIVVENEGSLPSTPFIVNVTVLNVVDLFAYQVKLYFDSTMLNVTRHEVWYPKDHIFAERRSVLLFSPVVSTDEKGAFVLFGATLFGGVEPTFNGSGTLFQMNFTAIAAGTATLLFSSLVESDTILYDSNLDEIFFVAIDGKGSSGITVNVTPEEVTVQWFINISGAISPAVRDSDVTVQYRESGQSAWTELAVVKTNEKGHYTYLWRATQVGRFELRASWLGDGSINGAVSSIRTVMVNAELPAIVFVAVIIIIAIITIYTYFMKVRKRKSRPRQETY